MHTPDSSNYLKLNGLSKHYGSAIALDGIDLNVARGEFVTLLGGSGSGKTTTLNCIAGFVSPTSGSIELDGIEINRLPAHKRNVGVVFQNYALFPHLSVFENVAYPLKARRTPRSRIQGMVKEALATVRLEGFEQRLPSELSGGQQQRVAMARAIVYRPDLLLLDEPLGALDKNLREQLQLEIMRLHRELGMTVIAVTHDQEEALMMSDRIAVYREGSIVQIGTANELYNDPSNQFVAEFVGESNVFSVHTVRDTQGIRYEAPGLGRFTVESGADLAEGEPAVVVVRPESMSLIAVGDAPSTNANVVHAEVMNSVYVGSSRKYIVRTADGQERQVRTGPLGRPFAVGEAVAVTWAPEHGILLSGEGGPL
ncbi:ABC transporter ATP-binding protein [Leucobacter rhizosphaerae]|uniref:Spermidine/putrescine import ATP-binding protein PotA n=1 Tax=Leucobacter rhizosphaerae TaxID=2932245 RepID=A0ABY4FZ03_9MICO|nr:ABC transporter ATP-binding protein [Leucobacter rhizosphaerae]UOQ61493.1 ABC transporter ATP-binding protein [Leucobacter rhizosphaerae]